MSLRTDNPKNYTTDILDILVNEMGAPNPGIIQPKDLDVVIRSIPGGAPSRIVRTTREQLTYLGSEPETQQTYSFNVTYEYGFKYQSTTLPVEKYEVHKLEFTEEVDNVGTFIVDYDITYDLTGINDLLSCELNVTVMKVNQSEHTFSLPLYV